MGLPTAAPSRAPERRPARDRCTAPPVVVVGRRTHKDRPRIRDHRTGLVAVAISIAALGLGSCGSAGRRGAERSSLEQTLTPEGDSYIRAGDGTHAYGPTLRVDGSPLARSYVGFELGALRGRVVHATLRVYAVSGSRAGYAVAIADGARWHGQRLSASRRTPSAAEARDPRSRGFLPRSWTSVDVTRLLAGRRSATLTLLPLSRTEVTFGSSESGATAPRLVVRTTASAIATGAAAFQGRARLGAGRTTPVVAAVGDIACDPQSAEFRSGAGTGTECTMRATARLAARLRPTTVLTLGDTQYDDNAYWKYLASFAPTWGRLKPIIHPAIGNHEYATPGAAGYFRYFGSRGGAPQDGYYSFDLGTWHVVALNSECGHAGGCGPGSPEEEWLEADLAAHPAACTLAYWHEPRFSSGQHGDAQQMATIWNDLAAAHADVVLSGHNHDYERFDRLGATPQGPGGLGGPQSYQSPTLDPHGIREFVVGTGGKNLYGFKRPPLAGEAVRNHDTYGVLVLVLHRRSYDWRFVPVGGRGGDFTDAGRASCS